MSEDCAFCRPGIAARALWESEHYRVLADEYPRCAGHVLLVTKEHCSSHMHAPAEWMPEFRAAHERVRQFLLHTSGKAAFYENGGARQEVPHAHLHGLPFDPNIPAAWVREGSAELIGGWDAARREQEQAGYYFYLETGESIYLVRRYKYVLKRVRAQLLEQTEARLEPSTGKMARGGAEMVERTRELWRRWSSAG
ncbi:MAG TPA: HIT domain-containing protein [Armatimonadota bacterium]|nr:HIT domain-containing protein [Armatimonadota bacterium]